jgi:hypothetical protein
MRLNQIKNAIKVGIRNSIFPIWAGARWTLLTLAALLGIIISVVVSQEAYNAAMTHHLSSAVVKVNADGFAATGFYLSYNLTNYIITNEHVCIESNTGSVTISDGSNSFQSKILKMSPPRDICIIEATDQTHYALHLGLDPVRGQSVTILGYPRAVGYQVKMKGEVIGPVSFPVTDYIDTNEDPYKGLRKLFSCGLKYPTSLTQSINPRTKNKAIACASWYNATMTSTPAWTGNSGSPAVDIYGLLIGVLSIADVRFMASGIKPASDIESLILFYLNGLEKPLDSFFKKMDNKLYNGPKY